MTFAVNLRATGAQKLRQSHNFRFLRSVVYHRRPFRPRRQQEDVLRRANAGEIQINAGSVQMVHLSFNVARADGDASAHSLKERALEEHFSVKMEIAARQEFHAQMLSVVREEMQAQGMKLVGALLAGIGTVGAPAKKSEAEPAVTELPEACGELPEELNGVLDLIA